MRVRAGRLKGRELRYPGSGLRPTKDIVRQALFNVLGRAVGGKRVVDLFAGGGALGIEALSRGAAAVTFVEQNRPVLRYLRENLRGLDGVTVVAGDVFRFLARAERGCFDVVLADPPYRQGLAGRTLAVVAARDLVVPGGLAAVEHHRLELPAVPDGWDSVKQGRYGESWLTVIRRSSE